MYLRMPGPKVQASQGGTTPAKEHLRPEPNPSIFLRMRQPTLQWPMKESQVGSTEEAEEEQQEEPLRDDEGTWILGATSEENEKYKIFLKYCEERREETRLEQQGDEERMRQVDAKREHWSLLRESISYLKEKDSSWRQRRIQEASRIREEEKSDRLAIIAEKKKRYGISRLSKEEIKRMKERTQEKVTLATAKSNYWKKYRETRAEEDTGETADAWEQLRQGVIALGGDMPERTKEMGLVDNDGHNGEGEGDKEDKDNEIPDDGQDELHDVCEEKWDDHDGHREVGMDGHGGEGGGDCGDKDRDIMMADKPKVTNGRNEVDDRLAHDGQYGVGLEDNEEMEKVMQMYDDGHGKEGGRDKDRDRDGLEYDGMTNVDEVDQGRDRHK